MNNFLSKKKKLLEEKRKIYTCFVPNTVHNDFLFFSKYYIGILSFEPKKVKFRKLIRANLAGGSTFHANCPVMSNLN